jgi:hypothetical protein
MIVDTEKPNFRFVLGLREEIRVCGYMWLNIKRGYEAKARTRLIESLSMDFLGLLKEKSLGRLIFLLDSDWSGKSN